MKTANHNTKTRLRSSVPTKAVSARKQRRMDKRAALKALANEREHDERAVKFHF